MLRYFNFSNSISECYKQCHQCRLLCSQCSSVSLTLMNNISLTPRGSFFKFSLMMALTDGRIRFQWSKATVMCCMRNTQRRFHYITNTNKHNHLDWASDELITVWWSKVKVQGRCDPQFFTTTAIQLCDRISCNSNKHDQLTVFLLFSRLQQQTQGGVQCCDRIHRPHLRHHGRWAHHVPSRPGVGLPEGEGERCVSVLTAVARREKKRCEVISSIDKLISRVIRDRCGNANSII